MNCKVIECVKCENFFAFSSNSILFVALIVCKSFAVNASSVSFYND